MFQRSSLRRRLIRALPTKTLLLALLLGVTPAEPAKRPAADEPILVIGIGDSLSHGTMDATNNSVNTLNAYLQRTVESLSKVLTITFRQPLFDFQERRISPFEIPTNVAVDGADVFSIEGIEYFKRVGAPQSFVTLDYLSDKLFAATLDDNSDRVMYPINVLAGRPVSQIGAANWLINAAPSVGIRRAGVILWIGNNDSSLAVLGSGGANLEFQSFPFDLIAPEVDPLLAFLLQFASDAKLASFEPYTQAAIERNMTNANDFAWQYFRVLSRLKAETASSGVDLDVFLLTLPYYSSIGYLMDSNDLEFYLKKLNQAYAVPPTFKRASRPGPGPDSSRPGDRISLLTFGFMYLLLDSGYPVSYVNRALETDGVQRDGLVLSEAEQQFIQDRIDQFNQTIKANARWHGPQFHLVDMGTALNSVLGGQTPLVIGGKQISRRWVRGSAFSIDGVHPGYLGQAFIANELLAAINRLARISAPLHDLDEIVETDPYVDQDDDGFAPLPSYPPSGLTELLFFFRDPDDSDANVQAQLPANAWDRVSTVLLNELLGISGVAEEAQRRGIVAAR